MPQGFYNKIEYGLVGAGVGNGIAVAGYYVSVLLIRKNT
tara:strand:+ start:5070 stop:5186 length:117 start_codon:yes stop_codon:yes gene_type:complete